MVRSTDSLKNHAAYSSEGPIAVELAKSDRLIGRLSDPAYLPSYGELTSRLGLKAVVDLLFGDSEFRAHPDHMSSMYPFLFDHLFMNEVLNGEYVAVLAEHVVQSARQINPDGAVTKVAETHAGRGRLSHFLRGRISDYSEGRNIDIVASDNYEYSNRLGIEPTFPVEKADYREALECNPDIVISSWMPPHLDCMPDFMSIPSVKEIILIGEPSQCGHFRTTAPHWDGGVFHGFLRDDLVEASRYQVGYSDDLLPYHLVGQQALAAEARKSRTISYRRVESYP